MKTKSSWIDFACLFIGLLLFNVLIERFKTPATEVHARDWLALLGALLFFGFGIIHQERNIISRSVTYGLVTISFGLLLVIASFALEYSGFGWTGTRLITLGMVAMASMGMLFVLSGLWVVQGRRHRRSKMV